jgi:hypothetical protein
MRYGGVNPVLLLFLGFILLPVSAIGQNEAVSDGIEWEEGRRLTWDDYALKVFKNQKGQLAITSVRHSVKGFQTDGVPDFAVKVLFIPMDSWTTDKEDLALLAHEQLHFDIGELFRRKIEKRINGLRRQGEKQKAVYRYVIRKELSEFRKFSKDYDVATKHGRLKVEQEKWQMDVWEQLKRLQ